MPAQSVGEYNIIYITHIYPLYYSNRERERKRERERVVVEEGGSMC